MVLFQITLLYGIVINVNRSVGKEKGANMSRSDRAPGRPRRRETDEAILTATLRCLSDQGYSRMSVDAIASSAGTTKPTIYRRWPSKEALAIAALAHLPSTNEPTPTGEACGG